MERQVYVVTFGAFQFRLMLISVWQYPPRIFGVSSASVNRISDNSSLNHGVLFITDSANKAFFSLTLTLTLTLILTLILPRPLLNLISPAIC